jgi:DtxR family transcriptional regulator, Mn-dependent transcriptional regulator
MSGKSSSGESAEMYLKSIFELTYQGPLVQISLLAERLGISVVSATEMIHKMVEKDLVKHTPYKGVGLTRKGRARALSVLRRHRLWEHFLSKDLSLPWHEVHELACQLEHTTSPALTAALETHLDHPETCPHGNPIPAESGEVSIPEGIHLDQVQIGIEGIVQRIHLESPAALSYLAARGVTPGVGVCVTKINEFDDLLSVQVGEKTEQIGRKMAARVLINPVIMA